MSDADKAKRQRAARKGTVTRYFQDAQKLITEGKPVPEIENQVEKIKAAFSEFESVHDEYVGKVNPDEEKLLD